jgi:glycerophosphoryl diester phosphodiesterase
MSIGKRQVERFNFMILRSHPYLDHDSIIAFAHRGGIGEHPENSMPAFQQAIDMGYKYIETDVHATKDGVLMAFHDDDLLRTCGSNLNISDVEIGDLQSARIDGTEPIPTLEQILTTWPTVKVNIDCKSDRAVEPLIKILRNVAIVKRVCIGSFSDRRLHHIRSELGPSLCTSLGPKEVAKLRLLSGFTTNESFPGAHAAQIPMKQGPLTLTTKRLVDHAHDLGLQVHVWTINEPSEMKQLIELGVDGIMTDKLQVLKDVLLLHNIWAKD